MYSFNTLACLSVLKPFDLECKAQDRYQRLSDEFSKFSVSITDLKGFKIPKAIGLINFYANKNELLNQTDKTLLNNKQWLIWNNGQKYINSMSSISVEIDDVLNLHKALFTTNFLQDFNSDLGKLRINSAQTNPKIFLNCDDKILNDQIFDVLKVYDLKNEEGYPYLAIENVSGCDNKNYSSGELIYFKGASVKIELIRWLVDLNDMISRYENKNADQELSPLNYLSDMKRWFLALRPFNQGNEEVVDALIDYALKRLHLPVSQSHASIPIIYLSAENNRTETVKQLQAELTFFEGCLFEYKTKLISSECSSLK